MPQLTSAARYQGRASKFLRCAYQAKVMKTLEQTSRSALRSGAGIDIGPPTFRQGIGRRGFGPKSGARSAPRGGAGGDALHEERALHLARGRSARERVDEL